MVFAMLKKALMGGGSDLGFEDVRAAQESGSHAIVDVRDTGEFARGHIPGSINLPLQRFDPESLPKDKPVILLCLSGMRSAHAHRMCKPLGRDDIVCYSGGMADWSRQGGPMIRA